MKRNKVMPTKREINYSISHELPAHGSVSLTEAFTYILDNDCLTTEQYLGKQKALWGDAGQPDLLLGQLQSYQSELKIDAMAALTAVLEEVLLLDPENTRHKNDDPEASKTKLVAAMVKAACAELTPWDEAFLKIETYQKKHWPWLDSKITKTIEHRYSETMEAADRRNQRMEKYLSEGNLTAKEAIIRAKSATEMLDMWEDNFSALKQKLWRICQSEDVVLTGIEAIPVEGQSGEYRIGTRKQIGKLYFDDPLSFEFRYFPHLLDELGPDPTSESAHEPAKRNRYRDVRIDVARVLILKKAFSKQIEPNRVKSEKAASEWLYSMVRSNPNALPDGKRRNDLRAEALKKFSGLIQRGFDDRVWPAAVKLSHELALKNSSGKPIRYWGSPGRPKKS